MGNPGSPSVPLWLTQSATKEEDRRKENKSQEREQECVAVAPPPSTKKLKFDIYNLTENIPAEVLENTESAATIDQEISIATTEIATTPPVKAKIAPPEDVLELAIEWVGYAKTMLSWRVFTEADNLKFAEGIQKIMAVTDLNMEGMRRVLAFVRKDDFWCKNAISPIALTKKKDGKDLRKIDYILMAMRKSNDIKQSEILNFAKLRNEMIEKEGYKPMTFADFQKMN